MARVFCRPHKGVSRRQPLPTSITKNIPPRFALCRRVHALGTLTTADGCFISGTDQVTAPFRFRDMLFLPRHSCLCTEYLLSIDCLPLIDVSQYLPQRSPSPVRKLGRAHLSSRPTEQARTDAYKTGYLHVNLEMNNAVLRKPVPVIPLLPRIWVWHHIPPLL